MARRAEPTSAEQTITLPGDLPPCKAPVPSVRLIQIIRTYCRPDDPTALVDLRDSLADGRYTWLRDDLAAAIRNANPTSPLWYGTIPAAVNGHTGPAIQAELRRLWQSLFPAHRPPRAVTSR